MAHEIAKEKHSHGSFWETIHDGYFSDDAAAAPLVRAAADCVAATAPEVVADLGGGTGYLLKRLAARLADAAPELVNVELSDEQQASAEKRGLRLLPVSLRTFTRAAVTGREGARVLYLMRSVLHYFGQVDLLSVLEHIRSQTVPGEYFIHQTACFDDARSAACLNALYAGLETGKWYPTTDVLRQLLGRAGWAIETELPAPRLRLRLIDLARRYTVPPARVTRLAESLTAEYGCRAGVLVNDPEGTSAYLHYRIFLCRAAILP